MVVAVCPRGELVGFRGQTSMLAMHVLNLPPQARGAYGGRCRRRARRLDQAAEVTGRGSAGLATSSRRPTRSRLRARGLQPRIGTTCGSRRCCSSARGFRLRSLRQRRQPAPARGPSACAELGTVRAAVCAWRARPPAAHRSLSPLLAAGSTGIGAALLRGPVADSACLLPPTVVLASTCASCLRAGTALLVGLTSA